MNSKDGTHAIRPRTGRPRGTTNSENVAPDACRGSAEPIDGEAISAYNSFIANWGEQRLVIKLWSPGDDGEFVAVNGHNGTTIHIGAGIMNIDAGSYQTRVANGVLAVCVDLTYGGTVAQDAYDVVKLSVEYSDDHYAADWNGGIPTQDNPRVLRPSGVVGAGFRIPTGAPTAKPVQGLTSLVVWAEITESARQTVSVSALLGFKVELAIFGG